MSTQLIPPVNTQGVFSFRDPYSQVGVGLELKVTSVRSLRDLYDSEEQPFDSIYSPMGMTEEEFNEDVSNNIVVVVFNTSGGEYIYVPANRIISIPKIMGVRYQGKVLAVDLGNLPIDMDLTLLKDILVSDIQEATGIISTVEVVNSSAINLVSYTDDQLLIQLLTNRSTVNKSYKCRYLEASSELTKKSLLLDELETAILNKLNA